MLKSFVYFLVFEMSCLLFCLLCDSLYILDINHIEHDLQIFSLCGGCFFHALDISVFGGQNFDVRYLVLFLNIIEYVR